MQLSAQTHFSQGWNPRLLEDLASLGTDTLRDSVPWHLVETRKGKYDFSLSAASWVSTAVAKGFDVVLVFQPNNPLYDNGNTAHSAAALTAFANFVVAALKAFPGVKAIEIGNEYNGNHFVTGPIAKASRDLRDDYYLKTVAAVTKAIETAGLDVKVIGASTHSIPVDYFSELAKGGTLAMLDGVSIHPYTTAPEHFAAQLELLRAAIGAETPIHVTEFGSNFASLADAPAYLAKMVSVMAAAGVESANWYAFARQSFFPNMELWDQAAGTATPAGVTFALLERLLAEAGGKVTRLASDSHTHFYAFGEKAAIIWSEGRSITLGNGVSAYDLAGNPITDLARITPDQPVVLYSDKALRADSITLGATGLVADSFHDFDLTNAPGGFGGFEGPWSYYALNDVGRIVPLHTMGGGLKAGEPWTPYLGVDWLRPLQLGANKLAPADFSPGRKPATEWAVVERFTADTAGTYLIRGSWDVADASEDGVELRILVNGKEIFRKAIFSPAEGHVFSLELGGIRLGRGQTIDFVIDSRGNARGDVTDRRIQIFDEKVLAQLAAGLEDAVPDPVTPEPPAPDPVTPDPDELPAPLVVVDHSSATNTVTIRSTDAAELLIGGRGNDRIHAGEGDVVRAGDGNDRIFADAGIRLIDGGEGTDTLTIESTRGMEIDLAAASIETVNGGVGDDYLDGSGHTVAVDLRGGAGSDTILGGSANDRLAGDEGDDFVYGGAGNDLLQGGDGHDVLDGGPGNDRLQGGAGADIFRFSGSFGQDKIMDFEKGDLIDLSNVSGLSGFASLSISYAGGRAVITIGEDKIFVMGVAPGSLGADDFLF